MQIIKLDHVNIRTTQLEVMTQWYTHLLGLRSGDRPTFPFDGAWLYAGDAVVVHLIAIDGEPAVGSESELKLEHFALTATGRDEFENRLKNTGENHRRSNLEAMNLVLFNVWDPDGNHIHIDFSADE